MQADGPGGAEPRASHRGGGDTHGAADGSEEEGPGAGRAHVGPGPEGGYRPPGYSEERSGLHSAATEPRGDLVPYRKLRLFQVRARHQLVLERTRPAALALGERPPQVCGRGRKGPHHRLWEPGAGRHFRRPSGHVGSAVRCPASAGSRLPPQLHPQLQVTPLLRPLLPRDRALPPAGPPFFLFISRGLILPPNSSSPPDGAVTHLASAHFPRCQGWRANTWTKGI